MCWANNRDYVDVRNARFGKGVYRERAGEEVGGGFSKIFNDT